MSAIMSCRVLLIVPYGIETKSARVGLKRVKNLLIVPYGIETAEILVELVYIRLLIVPYGIETLKELHYQKGQRAF